MKKYLIITAKLFLISLLFSSCSKNDDSGSPSGSSGDAFISNISQGWTNTAGTKTFFFGIPDSEGRFTGDENDGVQQFLLGKTSRFDISFTLIIDNQSNYIDYAGKLTDTTANQMQMVVYSKIDTLYLKQ